MRYLIKAPDRDIYKEFLSKLRGRVTIYGESERRLFLSVGDLTPADRHFIEGHGGEVREERRYTLESRSRTLMGGVQHD